MNTFTKSTLTGASTLSGDVATTRPDSVENLSVSVMNRAKAKWSIIIVVAVMFFGCGDDKDKTVPVTGVTLTPATQMLTIGGSGQLTATITPDNATDQKVTWNITPTGIISIADNGAITAMKDGEATVTATADGISSAPVTIKVNPIVVTGVTVPATFSIMKGKKTTLTATVEPDNATNKTVTWAVTDATPAGAATVDAVTGEVTGIELGAATITATTADGGKTAVCILSITQFANANFRAYVLENFDTNNDSIISPSEAEAVTNINCSGKSISSLTGIEMFTKLSILRCGSNSLTALDVSKNT
ncbi:MAG: Ig-like domain-containing protein, partial [Bacteroidales bacterium]|nr:Ig-like domain-containing protein [Bacteroidales bacterium]